MKRVLLLFLFTLIFFNAFSQTSRDLALKTYANFGWSTFKVPVGFDSTMEQLIWAHYKSYEMGYFSPAFDLAGKNGNIHEFELSRLTINRTNNVVFIDFDNEYPQIVSGEKRTNLFLALRYSYQYMFFKQKDELRLKPSLGFAAQPYFLKESFEPKVSSMYPLSQSSFGAMLSITPRIQYHLNDRFFLDLNMPVNIAELSLFSTNWENPALPSESQSATTFNSSFFPTEFLIRFGIGIKL